MQRLDKRVMVKYSRSEADTYIIQKAGEYRKKGIARVIIASKVGVQLGGCMMSR